MIKDFITLSGISDFVWTSKKDKMFMPKCPLTLYVVVILLLFPVGVCYSLSLNYNTALRAIVAEEDTGKGLVYASNSNSATPTYANIVKSENNQPKDQNKWTDFYAWAQPARGYKFNKWVVFDFFTVAGYATDGKGSIETSEDGKRRGREVASGSVTINANTGTKDNIQGKSWGGGAGDDVCGTVKADWVPATAYVVTYKQPIGGSYTVSYSYQTVSSSSEGYFKGKDSFTTSKETLELTPTSGDKKPYGINEDQHDNGYSYATDNVILSASGANFEAWYEGESQKSTNNPYTYTVNKTTNVSAVFKNAIVSTPDEVSVSTNSKTVAKAASVVFDVETTGTWAADGSGFTVELQSKDGPGEFTITSKSFSAGKLTVNFTFLANAWAGTSVEMHVTPAYGEGASAIIKGVAEEVVDYQARVLVNDEIQRTGTLTDMLAYANTLDNTPTLQLTQNITASATLQFKKPIILDLNNKKLSATAIDKLILVKGNNALDVVKLTITDNSYAGAGEIQLTRAAAATSIGMEIADANQVIYQRSKLTVSNTTAAAQGVHVTGTGNLLMQGGKIETTSKSDARGIYAESGFATVMSGNIESKAETKAYAFYTAAKTNINEGVSLTAVSTAGAEAAALYVNGGTAVLDNVSLTADSKTTNAYGAYVKAGKLSVNGGAINAIGANTIYGINVQAGASATIQQQAAVTAESTSGAKAYGVHNLGSVLLANINVTATASTNYATAVNSETSATNTTIEGGTYTATSATGYAYGLHHQYGTLNVDGGSFSATAAGNYVYGGRAAVDGTIANATLSAETTGSGNTAYGFVAGVTGKNITLTNCTIKAKSATSAAYAIYSRANTTATDCSLDAKTLAANKAYGLYAENGNNSLVNTSAVIEAFTTDAFGVDFVAGTLAINGGDYTITARQATANAAANSVVYGVRVANGKIANLSNAVFNVTASNNSFSQNAYGVFTSKGTCNSSNCTYEVNAATKAYGIYGEASSTLNLEGNIITTTTNTTTTAYGIYSNGTFSIDGDKVTSHTKTYTSYPLMFGSSAQGEVLAGKFKAEGVSNTADQVLAPVNKSASSNNVKIKGGFFYDIPNIRYYVPDGYDIYGVDNSTTEYSEGYYYTVNDHLPYENVCYIPEVSTGFPTLAEAFDYARNHTGKNYNIIMIQPYTLPAGNYSLPSNASLVVPYLASQNAAKANNVKKTREVKMISENRCLTFASGVNLDVNGAIEVSADVLIDAAGSVGYVQGPYGRIQMNEGSTMIFNSGANLYAYGYITGQGEIRVKNGATVYEDFQIHDMKGAKDLDDNWVTTVNENTYKVFPVNQYYIQNIEVPTKYYYGAKLLGKFGYVAANMTVGVQDVQLLGTDKSFFHVDTDDESSWVRKSYNPVTDRIIWETNSSASLGSMSIEISGYSFNSKDYILPITNNMTIHILNGKMNITQSTVLLPGSEILIDKTGTLVINEKDGDNNAMALYLYDQAEWATAAKPVKYSPSWKNGVCPRNTAASSMKDAAINVSGRIQVDGAIYTTTSGAAIYSDEINTGTIEFNAAAGSKNKIYTSPTDGTKYKDITSAKLRNGGVNGSSFTSTSTTINGDTYAYANIDGSGYKWTKLKTIDECTIADMTDPSNPVYYAKPQGYVAISDTEDSNHLFHSISGNRLFIQQFMESGCQWWEVKETATDGVYYCATNNTYYEYDEEWLEVKRKITFYFTDPKNDAADKKKVLEVNYMAKPDASIVSNPTKAEDARATYQFYGWKSSKTETEYAYTAELEPAEFDMYYLPIFTEITKKYTVTFKDAKNGANAPVEVFYGTSPEYAAVKASTAQYDYEFTGWKAANGTIYAVGEQLPMVEGAGVSYTAQWTEHLRSYDITWKDEDRVIETDEAQPYGTPTSFDDILPTRTTTNTNEYAFSGWLSSLDGNTYSAGNTPAVGGETTYSAQFSSTPRYMVKFVNYDGEELSSGPVTKGQRPSCAKVPRRDRDAVYYYVWTGWKSSAGTFYRKDVALPNVTAKETYTAQYSAEDRMYTVTFANIDNNGGSDEDVFGHSAVPTYPVSDLEDENYRYFFAGWKGEDETIYPLGTALPEVTADATYTALFTQIAKRMDVTGTTNIPENTTYMVEEVHVHSDGKLNIPATSAIHATNLIFDATVYKPGIDGAVAPASGEISGTEKINVSGNVYFDLTLNTDSRTWHAFGVPFEIGNLDNVKLIADGRTLALGRDYDIIYYNGAIRASQGPGAHCWEYVEDNGKTLTPGQGYMIAFTRAVNTVRFTKAADADLVYSASVRTKLYNSAIEGSNDWNAIATPALFHAALNAGVTYCQAHVPYEIGSDTYTPLQMADVNFVTGMSVYVQATANRAVTITPKPAAVPARRRAAANQSAKYEVTISTPNRTVPMDNLFIETTEEKENGYVTNQDLVKAGTSTKVAQMWVDRYDLKLCVNTMPVAEDGMAYYPLKIYVPQTGEYILNANNRNESETELYLTYDDEVVWNFANGIYIGHFEKGLSNHYGLRLGEKKAPEVATGFGEAVVDAHGKTTKVLIDGKVFIIREDRVYSIDGQLVK